MAPLVQVFFFMKGLFGYAGTWEEACIGGRVLFIADVWGLDWKGLDEFCRGGWDGWATKDLYPWLGFSFDLAVWFWAGTLLVF